MKKTVVFVLTAVSTAVLMVSCGGSHTADIEERYWSHLNGDVQHAVCDVYSENPQDWSKHMSDLWGYTPEAFTVFMNNHCE